MTNVYDVLESRGLINQVTDPNLKVILNQPITLYCGIDPTGDSLHIGHLLSIMIFKHFENYGHNNISVVGGATGLIGDPSFKKDERTLNTKDVVVAYTKSIQDQLTKYLDADKTKFVNNYDWTVEINVIDFLRDYGKNFTISYMLAKDSVSSRLETGISFTEFSYSILQALDFNHLYKNYNCKLQIGGSDQWGNITSGLEMIRRENEQSEAYGLTFPLVTKSDGTKFGKSESGTIWLDPKKTSPYEFYQFFLNTNDDDVIKYLNYFTFLSIDEIEALNLELQTSPHLRTAQKTLAYEVTKFVHGLEIVNQVLKVTKCLFTGDISELSITEIEQYFTDIKQYEVVNGTPILDALISVELATSKREGREFLTNGSITIAGEKILDETFCITPDVAIGGKYLMLKRGKKKIHFIKVV